MGSARFKNTGKHLQLPLFDFSANKLIFLQVTCEYTFDHGACVPQRVHTVVISVQHSEKISLEELRSEITEKVLKNVIPSKYLDSNTVVHINPCGLFIIGGPQVSTLKAKYSIKKRS